MNGPIVFFLIIAAMVAIVFVLCVLARPPKPPAPSRTIVLADMQEQLDAAIRAQSMLHGRKVKCGGINEKPIGARPTPPPAPPAPPINMICRGRMVEVVTAEELHRRASMEMGTRRHTRVDA